MEKRRLGRIGFESSAVMYGAASLAAGISQEEANRSVKHALANGVNHIDTAADYGNSESLLGNIVPAIRDRIFLATKTGQKTKAEAKAEIERSLERLQVESIDLIQLHAVCDIPDLDTRTMAGGSLEAALEAREQGLVKWIGITGHGPQAPAVHLEALNRFSFDAILTPLNYVLYSDPQFRDDFDALMEQTKRQDVALRVIKAVAKKPWDEDAKRRYATWYEPFDEQKVIDACVHFVLSFDGVCGLASAGDVHLFPKIVDAARRYGDMSREEAEHILSQVPEYRSPFGAPTSII